MPPEHELLLGYSTTVYPANRMHPIPPALEPMEVIDGICRVRPHGRYSLVEAVDLVKDAIAHCRACGLRRLLFNGTGLRDLPVPTLVDRFLMVEDWAEAARSMVVVVLVIQAEYIHPEKFGIVVASHLGLTCDVYTSEADALDWLATVSGPA